MCVCVGGMCGGVVVVVVVVVGGGAVQTTVNDVLYMLQTL